MLSVAHIHGDFKTETHFSNFWFTPHKISPYKKVSILIYATLILIRTYIIINYAKSLNYTKLNKENFPSFRETIFLQHIFFKLAAGMDLGAVLGTQTPLYISLQSFRNA